MVRPLRCAVVFLFSLGLLAAIPATAQAPDCTGISDVSSFDGPAISDFNGQLTTVRIISSGLLRPLWVGSPPDDTARLFILQQDGTIRIFKNNALVATPFLDINGLTRSPGDGGGNEEGLLGLAFHPDYDTNGWFFVYHTDTTGSNNVVARYTRSGGNPDLADSTSRQVVLTIPHASFTNHNGGALVFGPVDGHLYVGTGDGGSACDPNGNGQNTSTLLGKLLRLNVDSLPYTTTGNPFDGPTVGLNEIWAYGLRNPWRVVFDRITGALYIADVGQGAREEVNCTKAVSVGGENYGWRVYEGTACSTASGCASTCSGSAESPIWDYPGPGRSITGGYVYRGCRMSDLHGTYFAADHLSAVISSFRTDANCGFSTLLTRTADLDPDGAGAIGISQITSFGEDARGEVYIVDRAGEIFKIVPNLSISEVSGANASPLLAAGGGGDWSWEDLAATSSHPITSYRVYRSESGPAGTFNCVHQSTVPIWAGGDPDDPSADQVYYYLITARLASGEESRPGYASDGTPRVVNTSSVCP